MSATERDYWKNNNDTDSIKKTLNNIMDKVKAPKYNPYNDIPKEPTKTIFDINDKN